MTVFPCGAEVTAIPLLLVTLLDPLLAPIDPVLPPLTLLLVGPEGKAKLEVGYTDTDGPVISSRKLASAPQVAPSHPGASTVVNVAKGQLIGFVLVDNVAVSPQESSVEKQDVLQVSKALVESIQLVGTHKVPQTLVVTVLVHDVETGWLEEDSVGVVDELGLLLEVDLG